MLADHSGRILECNPAHGDITGLLPEETPETLAELFFSDPEDDLLGTEAFDRLKRDGSWEGFCKGLSASDDLIRLRIRLVSRPGDRLGGAGIIAFFHAVDDDDESLGCILPPDMRDPVTGLPNRQHFIQSLLRSLGAPVEANESIALLMINMDNFKNVNDSLGHAVGDLFLRAVAQRLLGCVRAGDIVARIGGDEFAILFKGLKGPNAAEAAARRVLFSLNDPISVHDQELLASASIGVALHPNHGDDSETLLRSADLAMRHAKRAGKHNFQLFSPVMNVQRPDWLAMAADLRGAFTKEEFVVHYQPVMEMATGGIMGMEALIRWMKPGKGLVYPDKFISLAEENGLIVPIGEWVLREACRQTEEWRRRGLGSLRLAVNLSARQLLWQYDIVEMVESVLEETGLPPSNLELEMTESVVMHNVEGAIVAMAKLSGMGVRLSLDDFGTGYSSLNYLKRFPLDTLKIDRSFTNDLPGDPDSVAIVEGIMAMARSLNLEVVAEGVENRQQHDFFRERDCEMMQGYYFSKPVPADEFEALLRGEDDSPTQSVQPTRPPVNR